MFKEIIPNYVKVFPSVAVTLLWYSPNRRCGEVLDANKRKIRISLESLNFPDILLMKKPVWIGGRYDSGSRKGLPMIGDIVCLKRGGLYARQLQLPLRGVT